MGRSGGAKLRFCYRKSACDPLLCVVGCVRPVLLGQEQQLVRCQL
jgi:hypothetical protein